jgi:restriction system protein
MARNKSEFLKWFGPLLDALRDLGDSGKPMEVSNKIAENLKLKDEILDSTLKSGGKRFHNQVAWARQYLVWEGYLDSSKFGTWKLTEKGKTATITVQQAGEIFKKWVDIHQKARKDKSDNQIIEEQEENPPEEIEESSHTELIDILLSLSSSGFEKVCKELLRESGFENVVVTGQSHDGGIDGYGMLELNPFVSFKVLFQCKRYKGSVPRAHVGDFRNAMIGRAEKGIILTTGTFSNEAIREASREGAPKIELIDGEKLVKMFEKVELGVVPKTIYIPDLNYFESFK